MLRIGLLALLAAVIAAQTPPAFEVASVKPASPDQRTVDLRDLPGRSSADHLSNARRDDRRGISGEVVATER